MTHAKLWALGVFLIFGPTESRAAEGESGIAIAALSSSCRETLRDPASLTIVELPPGGKAGAPNTDHQHSAFVHLLPDERHLLVRFEGHPRGEQTVLWDRDSMQPIARMEWASGSNEARLRSVTADAASGQMLGLGDFSFINYENNRETNQLEFVENMADEILEANFKDGSAPRLTRVPVPEPAQWWGTNLNLKHGFRNYSAVSLEHPYYLRSLYHPFSYRGETPVPAHTIFQIVNRATKQVMDLQGLAPQVGRYSDWINLFSEKFRFVALPTEDRKTLRIVHFAELDNRFGALNQRPGPEPLPKPWYHWWKKTPKPVPQPSSNAWFDMASLRHAEPISEIKVFQTLPYVLTQTSAGLTLWNAKEGRILAQIPGATEEFGLREKDGLLVYQAGTNARVFSLSTLADVAAIPDVRHIGASLFVQSPGSSFDHSRIFFRNDSGKVFRLDAMRGAETLRYEFNETGLIAPVARDSRFQVVLSSGGQDYFLEGDIDVGRNSGADQTDRLRVRIYSLEDGKEILSTETEMGAFLNSAATDAAGERVFFSAGKGKIGILDLKQLLRNSLGTAR